MRIVIQKVREASVTINTKITSKIAHGLIVLLGIEATDNETDIAYLCKKIVQLRIFNDDKKVMNLSVKAVNGEIIVVSQFTLFANTKKGNRPSYVKAAKPEIAIPLYQKFIIQLEKELEKPIQTGTFGADMKVALINDGPVTIIIDSKNSDF